LPTIHLGWGIDFPKAPDCVLKMLEKHDEEGFGNCRNHYECEAVCPAEISALFIAKLKREYVIAEVKTAVE